MSGTFKTFPGTGTAGTGGLEIFFSSREALRAAMALGQANSQVDRQHALAAGLEAFGISSERDGLVPESEVSAT